MTRHVAFLLLILPACAERPVRTIAGSGTTPPAAVPERAPADPRQDSAPPVAPASSKRVPDLAAEATLALPIPARAQAPEAPPAGWCGETAIQEGLLYLGVWAPQRIINKAGRPSHPDLYSPDIPVALRELGVKHVFYTGAASFPAYAGWVRAALDAGDPVLAGVKILPTAHPEWGLDHFVLVVGYGEKGLLVNTTWGTRQWVTDRDTLGISFRNAFYAIRLEGPRADDADATPARLTLVSEDATGIRAKVACVGVVKGARYRVERREGRADAAPAWSEDVIAEGDRIEREVTVDVDRPTRFRCARR